MAFSERHKLHIVLVHGWGYSPDIWSPLLQKLDYSIKTTCVDLGFFQMEDNTENLPSAAIYIAHSLGLSWVLKNAPLNMQGLISIAGFNRFVPYVDQKVIRTMKLGIRKDSITQLQSFWSQCNTPDYDVNKTPDEQRLLQGLDWLMEWNTEEAYQKLECPKLFLAAKDDQIVSPQMTEQNWPDEKVIWSDKGGHSLPITQPDWVLQQISRFLNV